MNTEPLISVVMPVFNCDSFIAKSVESILGQTLRDFELIIIDDCSTDKTVEFIKGYQDSRITLIQKPENSGLVASLNLGIELARGKFIARMDGDDISDSRRFEKQVAFLNSNPEVMLCGAWLQLLGTEEIIKYPADPENIKIALLDYCALAHPVIMMRKDFITTNKLYYDQGFECAEDYDLWTRAVSVGKLTNIPQVLLFYRIHDNQVTVREQYKQAKNSNLCRLRMLCYPITEISDTDIEMGELIVESKQINDVAQLQRVVNWLDRLFNHNIKAGFYPRNEFNQFVKKKKSDIIRRFYLHTHGKAVKLYAIG